MPKAPAHPKLTGGGGFRFEDHVVAFHLSHMLANRPVLGIDVGTIHRLTFMARPQGWFLDDMLIEFSGGSVRAAAVSIKSNRQITSGGVPERFVEDAWAQLLGEDSSSFVEGGDLLVLVTSPLGQEVHDDLHGLVRWSIHQRNEDVKAHVAQEGVGSPIKRQLFESLRCPAELAGKYAVQEEDIARLIRCLRFLEFDFQDEPSEDTTTAVEICRTCLTSGELDEARDLWSALCEVASRYRPEAGSIDLRGLLSELGGKFQLRDFPQYAASWTKLRDWCKETMHTIPDKIGGQVRIIRGDVTGPLVEELTATPAVVLLAPSGSGKSVIARQFVEEIASVADWLWLEASSATLAPSEIRSHLGLSYPLEEVLRGTTSARCYLVVDGVDRLVSFEDYRRLVVRQGQIDRWL